MHLCETQISKLHHLELGPSSSNLRQESELLNARQGNSRPVLASELSWQRNPCRAGDTGSIPGSERSTGEGKGSPLQCSWASLVALLVKNPPAMRETWVRSLGQEDPLEKGKATSLQCSGLENSMDCRVHGVTKVMSEQFSLSLPSKYWQSPWQLPLLLSPTQESCDPVQSSLCFAVLSKISIVILPDHNLQS